MDIFDILLDILLKPPQSFIGLFLIPGYFVQCTMSISLKIHVRKSKIQFTWYA